MICWVRSARRTASSVGSASVSSSELVWSDCVRSEEHTSELQSQSNLVCRLLLEKKKQYAEFTARSTLMRAIIASDTAYLPRRLLPNHAIVTILTRASTPLSDPNSTRAPQESFR